MIRLVAFDLDGTIGDTIPLCLAAFREATTPYVDHELSDDEIARTFGLNEEGMINQVVSGDSREKALNDFYVHAITLAVFWIRSISAASFSRIAT